MRAQELTPAQLEKLRALIDVANAEPVLKTPKLKRAHDSSVDKEETRSQSSSAKKAKNRNVSTLEETEIEELWRQWDGKKKPSGAINGPRGTASRMAAVHARTPAEHSNPHSSRRSPCAS